MLLQLSSLKAAGLGLKSERKLAKRLNHNACNQQGTAQQHYIKGFKFKVTSKRSHLSPPPPSLPQFWSILGCKLLLYELLCEVMRWRILCQVIWWLRRQEIYGRKKGEQKLTRPFVCVCTRGDSSSCSSRSLLYRSVYIVYAQTKLELHCGRA